MRRRALLASGGLAAVSLASGCLGVFSAATPPQLGWVGVDNYSPDPQQIRVQILREGDVVHESSHEIAGKTGGRIPGAVLECSWGDGAGPYAFRARVDDGEWIERSVADAVEERTGMENPDCVVASVQYAVGDTERLSFYIRDSCAAVPGFDGGCAFANATSTP